MLIAEKQLMGYVIDGIPDRALRHKARISAVTSKEELNARFEQIEQWDKKGEAKGGRGRYVSHSRTEDSEAGTSKPEGSRGNRGGRGEQRKRNCFSCGLPNRVSRDCPTKRQGQKCFKCGKRGNVASKCVEQPKSASAVDVRSIRKEYVKKVSINRHKVIAIIDTGSDINLMRTNQYVRIGAPELEKKTIRFRDVGAGYNAASGEFNTIVSLDERDYPMHIDIVSDTLMKHELLIGSDFLNSVRVTMNAGEIAINASETILKSEEIREVC